MVERASVFNNRDRSSLFVYSLSARSVLFLQKKCAAQTEPRTKNAEARFVATQNRLP